MVVLLQKVEYMLVVLEQLVKVLLGVQLIGILVVLVLVVEEKALSDKLL